MATSLGIEDVAGEVGRERPSTRIHFTDFFGVDPAVLEAHGAFNVSLINDLPLFVDPFLLFDSTNPTYRALHDEIIRYVRFLRDRALDTNDQGLLDHWFLFPEVEHNWLGFSRRGNKGNGLGPKFARALRKNLKTAFCNFGAETISRSSHLEKLSLLEGGVGRDHMSDFVTNLIKGFLLEYTQTFTTANVDPSLRRLVAVDKVRFDYDTRRWHGGRYVLPMFDNEHVLLTPKDILTKDEAWINRADLLHRFEDIYPALPDGELRAQVEAYFMRLLSETPTDKELREAAASAIAQYPQVLDYYIKDKEERGPQAHRVSDAKVRETEEHFVRAIRGFVASHLAGTDFYRHGDSFDEALKRVLFLKDVIENKDGYRIFYVNGKPLKREADVHVMYRLTWYASSTDINREVNNGRGPVDFKASYGSRDAVLVEFKLASNKKLEQNLRHQVDVYEAASDTARAIKVIVFYSWEERERVMRILEKLGLESRRDVVLIDARDDNKPSASTVKD